MRKGWQTQRLGDVCEIVAGQSPDGRYYNTEANGIPFYQGKRDFGERFIDPPTTWTTQAPKIARSGDILMSVRAPVGPVNFTRDDVCIGRGLAAIRCLPGLNREFLFYSLLNMRPSLAGKEGAVFASISRSQIAGLLIPVPPPSEQQRIVDLLDEMLEDLDNAKTNAEKNLQNARALFESHLQAFFTAKGDEWAERRLGDIATFKNGLNFTRESKGQTLPIVGVGDFQGNAVVPIDSLQSITIDGQVHSDYLIRRDDILTVRSNGSRDLVGRSMLVPDVAGMISYSGFVIRIRFDTRLVSPRFLLHFMRSSATRERLTRDGGGANISNINQEKLSALPVHLPPLRLQESAASQLDSLATETQRLEGHYRKKLDALDALRKSLLHQAFSGAL